MTLVSLTAQSRMARSLALVALLLFAGFSSLEPSHQHAADDTRLECLLCQGSMDSAAAPRAPAAETDATPLANVVAHIGETPRTLSVTPPARGPPSLS